MILLAISYYKTNSKLLTELSIALYDLYCNYLIACINQTYTGELATDKEDIKMSAM